MNSVLFQGVGSTFGVGIFLAGSFCATVTQAQEESASLSRPLYEVVTVSDSASASSTSALIAVPNEGDFRNMALKLLQAQESLGDEFESVLSARIEEFLD